MSIKPIKPTKPQLNVEIKSGKFYWVRPYYQDNFEPAKCRTYSELDKLYFYFTNGSRMEVERVWEVAILEYPENK